METNFGTGDAADVMQAGIVGEKPKTRRKRAQRWHAVSLREETYAVLRERANAAGVPVSSLLTNLIVPPAYVTPSVREAAPWVRVSDCLRAGDVAGAKAIVHDVLVALSRAHRHEVSDSATDWNG